MGVVVAGLIWMWTILTINRDIRPDLHENYGARRKCSPRQWLRAAVGKALGRPAGRCMDGPAWESEMGKVGRIDE